MDFKIYPELKILQRNGKMKVSQFMHALFGAECIIIVFIRNDEEII